MENKIILSESDKIAAASKLVLDGLNSPHSRTMYNRALVDFLTWRQIEKQSAPLSKAMVQEYRQILLGKYAPATVNQKLSAIRQLAVEAADNGLMDPHDAAAIGRVKGTKRAGVRSGNWLSLDQAQKLINAPDLSRLKGIRDRAILAVMLGGGLRRSEVASLRFEHIQQRDGRWVISDLIGKGGRVRTVPIQPWAKQAIDEWAQAAGIAQDFIFRYINRGGKLAGNSMTSQAIQNVVKEYAQKCGYELAAHDLRRTFAKLARKSGGDLMQIQLTLGHASVQTTERYIGEKQNLSCAAGDGIKLHLE